MTVLVVLSTCPRDRAASLAEALVTSRAAACVNVVDKVESFYFWEGKLNRDAESLLIIKTASDRRDELREAILRAHPYQVPEIVELEVSGGNPNYLAWVAESTRPPAP
jgi:periplasmic divalent cation tolerance protein